LLVSLEIKDFGLVDWVSMEFSCGINVLTGETGAGKSIIIDALQMVLGHRTSTDLVRINKEKTRVTAVFEISKLPEIQAKLAERGISAEEDGTLLMIRELARNGRNTCRLNGQAVTLSLYREAGRCLVDLQSQHEQQSLLSPQRQLLLLDSFGGSQAYNLRNKTGELYKHWRTAKEQLEILAGGARDRARRLDMLRYQVEEIDKAKLAPGEDEELQVERTRLANVEKILSLVDECYTSLYEGKDSFPCGMDFLGQARHAAAELCRLDESVKPLLTAVEDAFYQLEDAGRELAGYREQIQSDPARLQLVEERLFLIRELQRKYGDSIAEVLRYHEQAVAEIKTLTGSEENTAALEREIILLENNWRQTAQELTLVRQEAARQLEKDIGAELASLEMGRVDFCVSFDQLPELSPGGQDTVEFLISPNPGEPLRPLARIASGGELSRVMLAIRTILATTDRIPSLVFDEIDTGIGGKTLHAVAEKLAHIAKYTQVICVTHAAQVACRAGTHFYVFKEADDDHTVIRVELLRDEQRLAELARMLAGKVDGLAREHARQMLEQYNHGL
jgi:DNA repair protein RecN (Recombination protein N)